MGVIWPYFVGAAVTVVLALLAYLINALIFAGRMQEKVDAVIVDVREIRATLVTKADLRAAILQMQVDMLQQAGSSERREEER